MPPIARNVLKTLATLLVLPAGIVLVATRLRKLHRTKRQLSSRHELQLPQPPNPAEPLGDPTVWTAGGITESLNRPSDLVPLRSLPRTAPPTSVASRQTNLLSWRDLTDERIALTAVLALSLFFRMLWLDRVPGNIMPDEADNLWTIFRIYETGKPGLFGLDWKPQPALSMYMFIGSMKLFGESIFGFRAASAVLGSLLLIPFYALARRAVGPSEALAAALMLATSQWSIHFSRSGWENIHAAFYSALAAWALVKGLETTRLLWYGISGVGAALGLYGYFAGRLILPALLVYAPLGIRWATGRRLRVLIGFAVLTATSIALFLPQLPAIQEDWEGFNSRTNVVNVLRQPRPFLGETTDTGILIMQASRILRGFLLFDGEVFTDGYGRYGAPGAPPVDRLTALLFVLGLAASLWSYRRWRATAVWWTLLTVTLVPTQLLSAGTPDRGRAIVALPFIYLFVALGIGALASLMRRSSSRVLFYSVMSLAVAGITFINIQSYWTWINSPSALQVRQPAIELAEYHEWSQALRSELRLGKFGFNVMQWREAHPRER